MINKRNFRPWSVFRLFVALFVLFALSGCLMGKWPDDRSVYTLSQQTEAVELDVDGNGAADINRGGTNSTTAAGARTNLSVYSKADVDTSLSGKAATLGTDDNYVTDAEKVVIGNLGSLSALDAGTMTNTFFCTYVTGTGIECNTDPAGFEGGTDDQGITEFTLTGDNLTITLEDDAGGQKTVDLSGYTDAEVSSGACSGDDLVLTLSDASTVTVTDGCLTGSGGATEINDLTDVDTTGKATGKILVFDASGNLVVGDNSGSVTVVANLATPSDTAVPSVNAVIAESALKAPSASPTLTGTITVPTMSGSDGTTYSGTDLIAAINALLTKTDTAITLSAGTGLTFVDGEFSVTTSTYQAYDANLTSWAAITPSANGGSLVSAANYAAMRTLLDLEPGTDFNVYDANLTTNSNRYHQTAHINPDYVYANQGIVELDSKTAAALTISEIYVKLIDQTNVDPTTELEITCYQKTAGTDYTTPTTIGSGTTTAGVLTVSSFTDATVPVGSMMWCAIGTDPDATTLGMTVVLAGSYD